MLDTPFSSILNSVTQTFAADRFRLPEDWMQGRAGYGGWVQFREHTDCLTEEWPVALADAWPTPVLSMLTASAAASTLTWEMGFVHLNRDNCVEDDWWAYRSKVDCSERGYVHGQSIVWDPEGRLAVYSRQTSAVFAYTTLLFVGILEYDSGKAW